MPNLTGYTPLDIGIGLAFVYLLFSILCSGVQEAIAGVLDLRARALEDGLRKLLNDDGSEGTGGAPVAVRAVTPPGATAGAPGAPAAKPPSLADEVLGHGLVRGLYTEPSRLALGRSRRGPSYISPSNFALALLDVVAPGPASDPIAEVRQQIELADIPAGPKNALLAMARGAIEDRDHLRTLIEGWFNGAMERVSEWYRRNAQLVICILSLLVAVGLNVNTIGIAERLEKDNTLRAAVVAQASKSSLEPGAKLEAVVNKIGQVQKLGLPIGWNKASGDPVHAGFDSFGEAVRTLGGWMLTWIALSLGTPFWFGLLGKLTNLRSSGSPPPTTS
jgi:hypothetical protein